MKRGIPVTLNLAHTRISLYASFDFPPYFFNLICPLTFQAPTCIPKFMYYSDGFCVSRDSKQMRAWGVCDHRKQSSNVKEEGRGVRGGGGAKGEGSGGGGLRNSTFLTRLFYSRAYCNGSQGPGWVAVPRGPSALQISKRPSTVDLRCGPGRNFPAVVRRSWRHQY